MSGSGEDGPADRHLGESLAALVDGELTHDSRDRVLAHLATCAHCKAEADAQRELKNVFARSVLPGPSDGLLARLQALPATDAERERAVADGPDDEPPPDRSATRRTSALRLDALPGGRQRGSVLGPPAIAGERGFRIHEPGTARTHRGHRLAFAAAGAVSLAAFAIGGTVSGVGAGAAGAGSGAPSAVSAASGVTPAHATRPSAARSEEERPLPAVLTAQAAGFALLSAPAGPIGSSGQLFPLIGTGLHLAGGGVPSASPSLLNALGPR
ncbi:zf-HC2 domain-containing protein [Streptomyces marincola]|uniref:zf-HC2 domain-containing protein n=1 Tax=Streptomyces marincola TaxID=2878388 RepID=UPI001CF3C897|nr:zf-HC2 domain-containing protein [Streptomyces marincola]UCM90178.1 zf-HC2 domain-containing protein [Streptomyces marincola]